MSDKYVTDYDAKAGMCGECGANLEAEELHEADCPVVELNRDAFKHKDRFGRTWPYPKNELCPECGQPDSCGDCNHQPLTDADVADILGTDAQACPGCGCMPGDGVTADWQ